MKFNMKRFVTACLAALLILGMMPAPVSKVQAQNKTEKLTLFAGERVEETILGATVTKVSSSNSKVAKVKKNSSSNYKAIITAKKKGKANITIKTNRGTLTIKCTVLDTTKSFSFKSIPITNNSSSMTVLVGVKNKTSVTMDSIKVDYTIKSSTGEALDTETMSFSGLPSKSWSYNTIYLSSSQISAGVDLSQTTFTITGITRSINRVQKNLKKKVTVTDKGNSLDGTTLKVTLKAKNTASTSASVYAYIFAYDTAGNIIGYTRKSFYLNKKNGLETSDVSLYLPSSIASDYQGYTIEYTAMY